MFFDTYIDKTAFLLYYIYGTEGIMIFKSNFDKETLTARFDDLTSEARFAGADEQNDWVFQSSRKGDKIKIVRKPKSAYDPFASVFRGTIIEDGKGSAIKGIYTKSLPDYIFTFFVFLIYYTVCFKYFASAEDKTVPLILILSGAAVIFLLFSSLPHTRKRYGDFIKRVTGGEDGPVSAGAVNAEETAAEERSGDKEQNGDKKEETKKFRFRF